MVVSMTDKYVRKFGDFVREWNNLDLIKIWLSFEKCRQRKKSRKFLRNGSNYRRVSTYYTSPKRWVVGTHSCAQTSKTMSCLGHYDLPRRCPAPSSALSRPPPALAGPALVLPGDKHTTKDEGRAPFLARTAAVVSLPLLSVPATAPSTCCPAAKDDRSA